MSEVFSNIFWFIGEVAFKLVPATIATVTGVENSGSGPIPAGFTPITEPVTVGSIISFLESVSSKEEFNSLTHNWDLFVAVSMTISLVLSTAIIYCIIRIRQVRHLERMGFQAAERSVVAEDMPRTHLRWRRIQEQASSDSEQHWRLAILEADIMLNELLDIQGYKGDTMADKMKQVEKANFNSIDEAWEAHKVRNVIAHEGASFKISNREARRIIGLYGKVFREFKVIE
jgi:cell division protein FtsL